LKISEKELSTDNPEKDKFEMLISWLKEGGARFPKLYLQYYSEDYRGVHTLTKIPADEIVLYVPFKHIMTSDIAKASAIGQKIIQAVSGAISQNTRFFVFFYLFCFPHAGLLWVWRLLEN